jgi:DNA primase
VRTLGKDAFEKLLGDAQPLSQFMLRELSSRVDLDTHEGRARLLQEARPLVKQVAAPLLSLLLRKQFAQMAGISQQELDAQFQVKSNVASAVQRRSPPVQRSIVCSLIELLMLHPEFSGLVERAALDPGCGVAVIKQAELKALAALLEATARGETVVNWCEYFRESEHEELLRRIEAGLLKRQENNWSVDEDKAEFRDGWAQLQEMIRRGQLTALNEKARKQELSSEDKDRYRRLSQLAQATAEK